MAWKANDVAQELSDLFELDSGRDREGWVVYRIGYDPSEFALRLGDHTFVVTVEQVR